MLSLEETKKAIQLVLKNPKDAHLAIKNMPEFYDSVDKYLQGLKLSQNDIEQLASIYPKRALEQSLLKQKLTPKQKEKFGLAGVDDHCMLQGENGKHRIYRNPAERVFLNVEASLDKGAILEALSEVFHDAWMHWSKAVADEIKDEARVARWKNYWVPYDQLDEPTKDLDREWAKEALKNIESLITPDKMAKEMVTKIETQFPEIAKLLRTR